MKHAHRAGKRVPLAKKSGRRPSSPRRTILSREGIEARKKPREGPFSRQTEPLSSEKNHGRTRRRVLSIAAISKKREDSAGLIRRRERCCGSFNILDLERLCCTSSLVDVVVHDVQFFVTPRLCRRGGSYSIVYRRLDRYRSRVRDSLEAHN